MNKIETSAFKRLIGTWKTEGTIVSGNQHSMLTGTDSYECILDGNYILHKADVTMGNEKSQTFEMIFLDDSAGKANMHYYNSKGESGVMTGLLSADNFNIEGDQIKFEGTMEDQDTKVTGRWSLQEENGEWKPFIELKLTKQE